jgi:hypothetical protein
MEAIMPSISHRLRATDNHTATISGICCGGLDMDALMARAAAATQRIREAEAQLERAAIRRELAQREAR